MNAGFSIPPIHAHGGTASPDSVRIWLLCIIIIPIVESGVRNHASKVTHPTGRFRPENKVVHRMIHPKCQHGDISGGTETQKVYRTTLTRRQKDYRTTLMRLTILLVVCSPFILLLHAMQMFYCHQMCITIDCSRQGGTGTVGYRTVALTSLRHHSPSVWQTREFE